MAFESSGDQIDLSHLKTIFELYPSYHLGQVVVSAQSSPFFSAHCQSLNIMCNMPSQSLYRQIAAFGYFGSYILINSSKAFSASAFVSACQMLCNESLVFAWANLGKRLRTFIVLCIQHRYWRVSEQSPCLRANQYFQGYPSCRSKGPSNIAMAMLPPETSSCAHRDGTRADQKVTGSPVLERTLGNLTVAGPKPICRSRSGK